MDGSDDFFEDDDFVLDEETLAALEEAESKYQEAQRQTQNPSRSPQPPPPKKQKTSHDWGTAGLQRHKTSEFDELPEISISGSSYGLDRFGNRIEIPPQASNAARIPPHINTSSVSRPTSALFTNQHRPAPAPTLRPPAPPQANVAPKAQAPVPGPSRAPLQREPSIPQITQKLNGTSLSQTQQTSLGKANRNLKVELQLLKNEMEKTKEELQRKLQEAEDARLAKEGEVKILRNGIEKAAQHHAEELEKLRAAKAAAEAKQVEVERNLKGELDSLRTSYRFKNLGREADALRTPYTARAKRIDKQFPVSPAPFSSQRPGGSQIAGPSNYSQSPRNVRFDVRSGSPEPSQRIRKQTQSAKKHPQLPNFEDAFQTASPLRSRQRPRDKGKDREHNRSSLHLEARADNADSIYDNGDPASSPPTTPLKPIRKLDFAVPDQPFSQHVSSSLPFPQHDVDNPFQDNGDVSMAVDVEMPQASPQSTPGHPDEVPAEDAFEFEYPDPKEELKRIILTHSIRNDSSRQLTFQRLLSSPLPPSTSDDHFFQYNNASRELLEILGSLHKTANYETHLHTAATSLTRMAYILTVYNSFSPLVGLIHLIRVLLYSIPPFAETLLSIQPPHPSQPHDALHDIKTPVASQDSEHTEDPDPPVPHPPLIMTAICNIILGLASVEDITVKNSLLLECLGLVETLCWAVPDYLAGCLAEIPKNHGVLMALISSAHPLPTLQRSIQMLTFLASHVGLYKHFFSYPNPNELSSTKQLRTLPQIEQMAGYLIDPERDGSEFDSFKDDIISFFIALAISNLEAISLLNQSEKLIPCLVKYFSELSSAFWEEDADVLLSPKRAAVVMRIINRITSLLFYMVITPNPKYDLARRLQYLNQRSFNGIMSTFVVSVGRFAFADPPEWVTPDVSVMLEHTNDLAAILLEFVTMSPDLDLVWKVYQKHGNEGNHKHAEENEDEREARLAHPVPEDE